MHLRVSNTLNGPGLRVEKAPVNLPEWLCGADTSEWAWLVIFRTHEWMSSYVHLARARVYALVQYFGTCTGTSIINVFVVQPIIVYSHTCDATAQTNSARATATTNTSARVL